MQADEIKQKGIEVLSEISHLPESEIRTTDHLKNDLGLDSLDLVELEMEISRAFDSTIEIADDFEPGTVANLIIHVENTIGKW